ncbi:PREDICTED: prohormone-3 [Papilio xuthus]|uniref:Prohormone-3 n=1 Tax=Papilio xuthus TaxID=66420 RepID=A0AAJ6ZN57_PAPXU|nr:PREDICTED: prohormone-3 [Papilio xuthus]
MHRTNMILVALVAIGYLATVNAWGGLFNRFSADMLANIQHGQTPYRQYPHTQVEPDNIYTDILDGESADEEEPTAHCYSFPCATNADCCQGLLCQDTEEGGRCLPAFVGRKLGEICNRQHQCDAGLVCEEVLSGEIRVCRPPSIGHKQYNDDCNVSSECDISRGLCCIMQRRHRQKPRKSCGYFKESLVCIGLVATDQIREYVQHTAGEKRIGPFRLH